MLMQPIGFLSSIKEVDLETGVFLDWLEASNLLLLREMSQTDVVDYLIEEQIFDDQEGAIEFVQNAWFALVRRFDWLGEHSPFVFDHRWMRRQRTWTTTPAHTYCVVVSFGSQLEGWHKRFGPDYNEQGRLFELISFAAMKSRFVGWNVLQTGWCRDRNARLNTVLDEVISAIDEKRGMGCGLSL